MQTILKTMTDKCQMCGCETNLTAHHLIPQVKCHNKYKQIKNDDSNIIMICRSCHDQLHALYTENELRDRLSTLDEILSDEKITKFISWKQKHPEFRGHAKMSNDRKSKI